MNPKSLITAEIVRREALQPQQVEAMFSLLSDFFDGVSRERFETDLAEKDRVILLSRDNQIKGFSTLLAGTEVFQGETLAVVYSGDTIVAPEAWGTTALPKAWVAAVEELRAALPEGRCFWLLLASGFRTYRFLPVFWRDFYPRYDRPTPATLHRLLDHLAQRRFGKQFDAHTGIVRFAEPQRLRHGLAEIAMSRESNPHVRFFTTRNPAHSEGDELVCLTEVCPENLTSAGRRMMPCNPCAITSDTR